MRYVHEPLREATQSSSAIALAFALMREPMDARRVLGLRGGSDVLIGTRFEYRQSASGGAVNRSCR